MTSTPLAVPSVLVAALVLGACSSTAPSVSEPPPVSTASAAPANTAAPTATATPETPSAAPADATPTITVTATVTASSAATDGMSAPASVLSTQTWEEFTYPRFHQSPISLHGGEATVRDTYFKDVEMPARLHSVVSGEVSGSPATLVVLTVTDHHAPGWPNTLYLIYLFRARAGGAESTASARATDTTGASVRWTLSGGLIHQSVAHPGDSDEWMGGPQSTWLVDGVVGNRGPQLFPPLYTRPDPMAGDS